MLYDREVEHSTSIPTVILTFFQDAENVSWHLGNLNSHYKTYLASVCKTEDQQKCLSVYSFFSEMASKKYDSENKYLLTTALFHALRERYGAELAIMYPSSMTENKGINIVLSKEILDRAYLRLEGAVMFRVNRNSHSANSYLISPITDYVQVGKDNRFRYAIYADSPCLCGCDGDAA